MPEGGISEGGSKIQSERPLRGIKKVGRKWRLLNKHNEQIKRLYKTNELQVVDVKNMIVYEPKTDEGTLDEQIAKLKAEYKELTGEDRAKRKAIKADRIKVPEIRKKLDEAGVEYARTAGKGELLKLLEGVEGRIRAIPVGKKQGVVRATPNKKTANDIKAEKLLRKIKELMKQQRQGAPAKDEPEAPIEGNKPLILTAKKMMEKLDKEGIGYAGGNHVKSYYEKLLNNKGPKAWDGFKWVKSEPEVAPKEVEAPKPKEPEPEPKPKEPEPKKKMDIEDIFKKLDELYKENGNNIGKRYFKDKLKSTNNWGKYGMTEKLYNDWWLDLNAAKGFKTTREKATGIRMRLG
jgi:hypothetical protein